MGYGILTIVSDQEGSSQELLKRAIAAADLEVVDIDRNMAEASVHTIELDCSVTGYCSDCGDRLCVGCSRPGSVMYLQNGLAAWLCSSCSTPAMSTSPVIPAEAGSQPLGPLKRLWHRYLDHCGWFHAERAEDAPPALTPLKREFWTGRQIRVSDRAAALTLGALIACAVPIGVAGMLQAFYPFGFDGKGVALGTALWLVALAASIVWQTRQIVSWRRRSGFWIHQPISTKVALDELAIPVAVGGVGLFVLCVLPLYRYPE